MKNQKMWLAVLVVFFWTTQAHAQNYSITWDEAYPKAGTLDGDILVKGSITLAGGWKLKDSQVKVRAWQSGKMVTEFMVNVNKDNTWGESAISNLQFNTTYNVTVEVRLTNTIDATIITIPKSTKSK